MNWYILYVLTRKTDYLIRNLNKRQGIEAFVPKYEYYRRIDKTIDIKPMFNGYIFIKTKMTQVQFNLLLQSMQDEKDGLIRQLIKQETSALREEEIKMFNSLLDSTYITRMSQAYLDNNRAKVYKGPLRHFEENIIKVDKHNQLAYLNLSFMDRNIRAGLILTSKSEAKEIGLPPLE